MKTFFMIFTVLLTFTLTSYAQVNYDESKVPSFKLPPILVTQDGKPVANADMWWKVRRPEILKMMEEQEYGKVPDRQISVSYKLITEIKGDLGGKADMKEVKMIIRR